jgi:hypothetical protein
MRASDSSGRQTATAQEEIAPGRESRQDAAPTGVFLEGRNAIAESQKHTGCQTTTAQS